MRILSNEVLLDSYFRALDLKLDREFIELLLKEIQRRKLHIPNIYPQAQAN
jgi:developmental checkpoint coupling sporulation initiation to replication initiation